MNIYLKKMLSWVVLGGFLLHGTPQAWALPEGITVVEGDVSIDSSNPDALIITASNNSIIEFSSFSIGGSQYVQFIQPLSTSSVLGRVTGNTSSDIFGGLFSNGQFILINPNGIYFAPSANIQTGSLIASTLDIQNAMYVNGNFVFEKLPDAGPGSIINEASIIAAQGGSIALLSEEIQNKGVLQADLGSVVLGVGEKQTLTFDGQGLINLVVDTAITQKVHANQPSIENTGTIRADGGKIMLSVKTLNETLDTLINNTGVIQANEAVERDGKIEFLATGDIHNPGTVEAQGGSVSMVADGDISSLGILKTDFLYERGETFNVGGVYQVATSNIDNEDGAITLNTGDYSGTTSDNVDIIINTSALISLTGATVFAADADGNGSGAFTMNTGSIIDGQSNSLQIKTGQNATLTYIHDVTDLQLSRQGSATPTYTVTTDGIGTDRLTIDANTTLAMGANTLAVGSDGLILNGNLSGSNGGIWQLSGDLSVGNSATTSLTLPGTVYFWGSNLNLTNLDSLTSTGSLLNILANTTLTSAGHSFNNIQLGSSNTESLLTLADDAKVNGTVTFPQLAISDGCGETTYEDAGTFSLNGHSMTYSGATLDFTYLETLGSTGTFIFNGTTSLTSDGKTLNNITIGTDTSGGSLTLNDTADINGLLLFNTTGGTAALNSTSRTVSYAGATLDLTSADTFTTTGSTWVFDGTTSLTSAGKNFNNITIGTNLAGGSLTLADTTDINGTLAFNTNGGTAALNSTNRTVNYAGSTLNLTNADTFTTTGSTFIFDGTTAMTSAGKAFNNVTIGTNSSSGSLTLSDTTDINGTLAFNTTGGTAALNSTSRTVNYAGSSLDLTTADTFTTTGSTWNFDGTNQQLLGSGTFNNLTKTVSSADTFTFGAGSTQTINGTLTLQGSAGNLLSLRSSSTGSQWTINPQGTKNLSYLDVKDSNNTSGSYLNPSMSFDSLNNSGWFTPLPPVLPITQSAITEINKITANSTMHTSAGLSDYSSMTISKSGGLSDHSGLNFSKAETLIYFMNHDGLAADKAHYQPA